MSRMEQEIGEAPDAVARQEQALARPLAELGARLGRMDPQVIVTCARGSSAHAATFGKHLIERYEELVALRLTDYPTLAATAG